MVRYTDNTMQVKGNVGQKTSTFLRLMLDKIHDIAKPKTPKKDGNLKNDVLKQVLGHHGTMVWNKDYAAVQERGSRRDGSYRIKNYSTPGTGPTYARDAVNEGIKDTPIIASRAGIV